MCVLEWGYSSVTAFLDHAVPFNEITVVDPAMLRECQIPS